MQLFYIPSYSNEEIVILDKEESSHISKVLRIREGEAICLTDGLGSLIRGEILEANPKRCCVKIVDIERNYKKRDFKVHLAIAPTKNSNRIEWLLEKAVEIGIDEITFLQTEHSERRNINIERLEKIVISAMKQSLTCWRPTINDITDFSTFIGNLVEDKKYLCCCSDDEKVLIKDSYSKGDSVVILIGPEGDFSNNEILQAKDSGCELITLGEQRLRIETAAFYAISQIHFLNQ